MKLLLKTFFITFTLIQAVQAGRYYNSENGRFIQRDPLGYVDGMSLYNAYFAEQFQVDPMGTVTETIDIQIRGNRFGIFVYDHNDCMCRSLMLDLSTGGILKNQTGKGHCGTASLPALLNQLQMLATGNASVDDLIEAVEGYGIYDKFKQAMIDAAKEQGINAAIGAGTGGAGVLFSKVFNKVRKFKKLEKTVDDRPHQKHHYATDKNKKYTPRMKKIAEKYDLHLDDDWNKELLPHQGRHPNEYHEFVERQMNKAAKEAGDDVDKFKTLFDKYVKQPVRDNPDLLRKAGWKK